MKILIISRTDDVYTNETILNLKKYHEISVLDIVNCKYLEVSTKKIFNFGGYLFPILKYVKICRFILSILYSKIYLFKNKIKADCVHILYFKNEYIFFEKEIKSITNNLFITIYGGDFFYSNIKKLQKNLYDYSTFIFFNNEKIKLDFLKYYKNYNDKVKDIYFGFEICNYIDELRSKSLDSLKLINIEKDNLYILIGTNGEPEQNHLEIYNSLYNKINKKVKYIFPLTYTNDNLYMKNLIIKLNSLNNPDIIIINKFLTNEEVAELRKITNIMIQFQPIDSLSGALLQAIYSSSLVIIPEYQSYPILEKLGIFLIKSDSIAKIYEKVNDYILNYDVYSKQLNKNIDLVKPISKWEYTIIDWLKYYSELNIN